MTESESGISDLMEDMDLEDTGYEQDFDMEIIDGFYYQNSAFMNDKVQSFAKYWMRLYSDCCLQRDYAMELLNDNKPEDAKVILRSFPTTEGAPNVPQLLFETEETRRKKRKRSAAEVECDGFSLALEMKAKRRVSGNFDDWVNSRCKVKQTRARQLRKFYKQLSPYKKVCRCTLPLKWFLVNCHAIRKYFEEHREVAKP